MGLRRIDAALRSGVKGLDLLVLIAMSNIIDDDQEQSPIRLVELIDQTGLSERTVRDAVQRLMASNTITAIPNAGHPTQFRINIAHLKALVVPGIPRNTPAANAAPPRRLTPGGPAGDVGGQDHITQQDIETLTEENSEGVSKRKVKRYSQKNARKIEKRKAEQVKVTAKARELLVRFNEIAGTAFRGDANARWIAARLKDGATAEEILLVAEFKSKAWDGEMRAYVRPSTLYRPTKFPGYLAEARTPQRRGNTAAKREEVHAGAIGTPGVTFADRMAQIREKFFADHGRAMNRAEEAEARRRCMEVSA